MKTKKDISVESAFEDRLKYLLDGQNVVTVEEEALIVRAVNRHEDTLHMMKAVVKDIENGSLGNALSVLRFAIAKAEGK